MNRNVVLPFVLMLALLPLVALLPTLHAATPAAETAVSVSDTAQFPPNISQASTICSQLIINGDMEQDLAWIKPATPATAAYSTSQAHSGERSIRIGIISGQNREAYSSAYQQLTIPASTITATLTFWLYPVSSGTLSLPDASAVLEGVSTGQPPGILTNDAQYALIRDQNDKPLRTLLWTRRNSQTWEQYSFDLSDYIGQTIRVVFGVYNNGTGGITGMYLDDVSLDACRPMPEMPYKTYLPIILHNHTSPEPPPPPPSSELLMIDDEVVTRLIGHPDSAAIYALTAAGFYRSDDGANTWSLITDTLPVTGTIHLAANQPETLYAGAGFPCFKGGSPTPFWRSDDSGLTWTQIISGTNLEPMAVHPADRERVYAQTCDGPYLSNDAGESWTHQPDDLFLLYNTFNLEAAAADDWQTVYIGGNSEGGSAAIIGSQDGGASWTQLSPLDLELWAFTTMTLDPISNTHLYFGDGYAFWGTLDGGTTWYSSTTGLEDVIYDPEEPGFQTYGLLSIVILPANREFLILGTAEGLFTSDNRGLTWHKVMGLAWEDARISELLLRTADPTRLFLTTEDGVYVYHLGP